MEASILVQSFFHYIVLHHPSHTRDDLLQRASLYRFAGRYSCTKLQICRAISLVKLVKKPNYSLKKIENMFISLTLHTSIIKMLRIIR